MSERVGSADVAGKYDVNEAGEFGFQTQPPYRHTRQQLAQHHGAFHVQSARGQIARRNPALGHEIARTNLEALNQVNERLRNPPTNLKIGLG